MSRRTVFGMVVGLVCLGLVAGVAGAQPAADEFTITSIEPDPEESFVSIKFSAPVSWQVLQRNLETAPSARIQWYSSEYDSQSNILRLKGDFKHGVQYRISLPRVAKGAVGSVYRETLSTFTMPDRKPLLKFAESQTLIERDSRQMLHVNVTNVDELLFEGVSVPPALIPLVVSSSAEFSNQDLSQVIRKIREWREMIQPDLEGKAEYAGFLGEVAQESQLFFSQIERNKMLRFSAPLTFRKSPELGGLLLCRFRDNASNSTAKTEFRMTRVTDLGISVKRSEKDILIWVTSLKTGAPESGVSVFAFGGEKGFGFPLGKTDKQGLLYLTDGIAVPYLDLRGTEKRVLLEEGALGVMGLNFIVACSDSDTSYIELGRESLPVSSEFAEKSSEIKGVVFTERGVYRPGEKVYFKGTVREWIEETARIPKYATCSVEIVNPFGSNLYQAVHSYSEFGTVHGEIDIPSYAKLGVHHVVLRDRNNIELARTTFNVEEFRQPRHTVDVLFSQTSQKTTEYINQDKEQHLLECRISSRYLAGGPLKHGAVRWKMSSVATNYPQKKHPAFHFGHPMESDTEDFLETGESILDEQGEVVVTVPLGRAALAGVHGLKISATVVDFDGRAATGIGVYQAEPKYLVGISDHPESVEAGEPQLLKMLVLNEKRQPVRRGTVQVTVYQRGYYYHRMRNQDGNLYWKWNQIWNQQYSSELPLVNGETQFDFDFNWGSRYLVQCTYKDTSGNEYTSGTIYDVAGPHYWHEEQEPRRPHEKVQLLPDKKEYSVGDTIRVLVKSAKPMTSCLLTVERGSVLEYRLVQIRNNEISIPIGKDFYPNAYISLVGMVPRGDFPTYQGEYDTQAPNFACGTVNVKIRKQTEHLKVQIQDGEAIPKSLPGQTMTLNFFVTNESDQPVVAELAVGVVDEQVLALTRYKTPDLISLADFLLPLKVLSGENRTSLQMQTPFRSLRNEPLTGGDGADWDERRDPLDAKVRKDFRPVAYFNPTLLTDSGGKASVTFEFPDSMTTYRVYVVACDAGSRFASAEKAALVVKDFYLEPGLPSFLINGDTFRSQVSAFNKTDRSGPMSLETKANENLTLESPSRTYTLSAYDRTLVPITGRAMGVGSADIRLSAVFEPDQDAIEISLPVRSGYQRHRDIRFGAVKSGDLLEYSFPSVVKEMELPQMEATDFTVQLTLSGSPFLRMKSGLRYLLQYPYGCIEQTSSGVIPLAALRGLIRDGLIPGITIEEADKFLGKGVERILSMQLASGGFTYWPRQGQPSTWGSLYAITALAFAREAGFPVPEERFMSSMSYLTMKLNEETPDREWNDSAYGGIAAFILAKSGSLSREELDSLQRKSNRMGKQGQLMLLFAANKIGALNQQDTRKRILEILNEPKKSTQRFAYDARHREPAIALYCSAELIPDTTHAAFYAEKLLASMNPDGRWSSTSDTGWVLMALGHYFKGMNLATGTAQGVVRTAGQDEMPFELRGADSITLSPNAQEFFKQPSVRVETEGDFAMFYELEVTYPRLDYARDGYSKGFTLDKSVKNTDGGDTIRVGDVVQVEITLSAAGYDYRYLVLDDPLPAGFVAINPALANEEPMRPSESREEDFYWNYWDPDGFYKLVPNHLEIRDDRVLVFRDNLWGGEYRYTYHARAVCAGTFKMPSTMVQLMYDTDVCAYTPETMVTIEERQ